jgi:hypothetical protein
LAAEIRDPDACTVFATARTIVVGAVPLSEEVKLALRALVQH